LGEIPAPGSETGACPRESGALPSRNWGIPPETGLPPQMRHRKCATVPSLTADSLTGRRLSKKRRGRCPGCGAARSCKGRSRPSSRAMVKRCTADPGPFQRRTLKRSRHEARTGQNSVRLIRRAALNHNKQPAGPSCPTKTSTPPTPKE